MFQKYINFDDPAYGARFVAMHVDRARRLLDTAQKTEPKSHMLNSGISSMSHLLAEHNRKPIEYDHKPSLNALFNACDKLAAGILYSLQGYTNTDINRWSCSEITGHDFRSGTIERNRYRVCDRCGELVLIPKEERERLFGA